MKKGLMFFTASVLLVASSSAYSEFYIGASVGQTNYGSDFDKGTSFGFRAGYSFNEYLAVEGGYTDYGNTEWDYYPGVSVSAEGVNFSAIAMIPIAERFNIYAKAGVDYLRASGDTGYGFTVSVDDTEFAYGAGVNIGFTDTVGMFVEYGGNTENISAGVIVRFGTATKANGRRAISNNTTNLTQQRSRMPANGVGSQLRALDAEGRGDCEFITSITRGAGGPGDASKYIEKAMEAALTEAAAYGADSYFVVNTDIADSGAVVVLESFKCE